MRKLMNTRPKSRDQMIMSLDDDIEFVEIVRKSREAKLFRLDLAHVRFLKKEAKRLGWSQAAVVRGIINMYMEEKHIADRDAAANGDLGFWVKDLPK